MYFLASDWLNNNQCISCMHAINGESIRLYEYGFCILSFPCLSWYEYRKCFSVLPFPLNTCLCFFAFSSMSSEATATSERCIVWKLFRFFNPDLLCLCLFHAKFRHLKSKSLASITFSSKKPHLASQLFISDLNGGCPL